MKILILRFKNIMLVEIEVEAEESCINKLFKNVEKAKSVAEKGKNSDNTVLVTYNMLLSEKVFFWRTKREKKFTDKIPEELQA